MSSDYKIFCAQTYENIYSSEKERLFQSFSVYLKNGNIPESRLREIETAAQKEAIKMTTVEALNQYNTVEASLLWKAIYETHVHRKSGIDDAETINKVISADQSWKKSSGHAFEEMIKLLANMALQEHGIEIVLQRDLSTLIKASELDNEPRDISWLKEQINASIFDLYAIIHKGGKQSCFGCIQSKTSIRDRVTRDREPSIAAMRSFFWSTVIVLDGDFLKNPKFINMVNGGSVEHPENGWHGMYVFSDQHCSGRIYPTNINFVSFRDHALKAASFWLSQRQWFNGNWNAVE